MTTQTSSEYDANHDGKISYAERSGLMYPENELIIDDDIELGANGFQHTSDGSSSLTEPTSYSRGLPPLSKK